MSGVCVVGASSSSLGSSLRRSQSNSCTWEESAAVWMLHLNHLVNSPSPLRQLLMVVTGHLGVSCCTTFVLLVLSLCSPLAWLFTPSLRWESSPFAVPIQFTFALSARPTVCFTVDSLVRLLQPQGQWLGSVTASTDWYLVHLPWISSLTLLSQYPGDSVSLPWSVHPRSQFPPEIPPHLLYIL